MLKRFNPLLGIVAALAMTLVASMLYPSAPASAEAPRSLRTVLSLDGTWQVEDGIAPDRMPQTFAHSVPVPGLVHSASPAFPDVDKYQTRQLLSALVSQGRYSAEAYKRTAGRRASMTASA